mmetsp:Transcript_7849/g.17526  ORF Transcript_7849/g.17526 Transcript_7849/m.17526 type:complete len:131 (+) Transcript_7849:192-584(+)
MNDKTGNSDGVRLLCGVLGGPPFCGKVIAFANRQRFGTKPNHPVRSGVVGLRFAACARGLRRPGVRQGTDSGAPERTLGDDCGVFAVAVFSISATAADKQNPTTAKTTAILAGLRRASICLEDPGSFRVW